MVLKFKFNKKQKQQKQQQWKWYSVEASPFQLLPQEDQDRLTTQFSQLVNALTTLRIYVRNDVENFEYEGEKYTAYYNKFYVATTDAFIINVFNMRETEEPKRLAVKEEYPNYVKLEDGTIAKTWVVYDFPDQLPDGFLYELYGVAHEINVLFKQIQQSKAVRLVNNARLRLESLSKPSVEQQRKLQKLRDLGASLGGNSRLYELYIHIVLRDSDPQKLAEKEALLKEVLNSRLLSAEAPGYVQKELYEFKTSFNGLLPFSLTKNFIDSVSASVLYPFVSEDLIDEGGVFLGISGSNTPIIYNPFTRTNYNIVILGETGSGKSMTAKVLIKRLMQKFNITINGVDPENEYVKVADQFDATGIIVRPGQKLGLDPFKLQMDPVDIAELFGDLYYVPQELRPRLRKLTVDSGANDIDEYMAYLQNTPGAQDVLRYLEAISTPPDVYVFQGAPPDITGNIIFGIRELRMQRLKVLVSALLASLFRRKMMSGKQLFFFDEAWIFSEYPSVLNIIQEISRRGRKYGDILLFITQRPWDVYSSTEGRTILEQSATSILLRQRSTAVETLTKAYQLSQSEIDFLLNAEPGQGIIKAGNYRLSARVMPTSEELKTFSTRYDEFLTGE